MRGQDSSSTATVITDRSARYGTQLASHLGRKAEASWDDEAGTGTIRFGDRGHAELRATPAALVITLQSAPEHTKALQDVLGRHLERFGERDGLTVTWSPSS